MVREFCPIATSNLLEILSEVPDAKIVVSSSWRIGTELAELRRILNQNADIPEERVIDKTPVAREASTPRGVEIQAWLDKHPEVTKFVIIDDDDDMAHLSPYLVNTSTRLGLMLHEAEKAIKMLEPMSPCDGCGVGMKWAGGGLCDACLKAKVKGQIQ